ncbi:Uncharacterised protein [Mycobacteroides abscessus subsp. abscessus]|nr:Uncharacterised protein [Mycobacteroides abscessus subsp. abscessus]
MLPPLLSRYVLSEARSFVFASRIVSAKVRSLETPTLPSGAGWESFESEADTDSAAVMSMPVFWIVSGYAPSVSSSVFAM